MIGEAQRPRAAGGHQHDAHRHGRVHGGAQQVGARRDADGGVLRRARRRRDELHGGPVRDRPRALPAPGDRRLGDLLGTRSTSCGGSSRTTRTSSATSPGPAGTTWARPASAGSRPRTTPRPATSARRTRGCSRTSATSTSPGTGGRQSYYREIVFGLRSDPYLAVLRPERHGRELSATPWAWSDTVGSWSWTGAEGEPVTVEVYSDADEVELLLDGESLGIAPVGEKNRFRAEFEVTYTPGELVAVARTGGEETGRFALRSANGPVGLAAAADREQIRADDEDLAYVTLTLQDAGGTVVAGADREVTVSVEGPGVLAGFGSAAPATEESYLDDVHTTFDGRALAVVRPTGTGTITRDRVGPRLRPGQRDGGRPMTPRWGIVGTGRISATTVGDLHLTENVDLVAVASRTAASAEAFAAEHEVPRCLRRLRRAVRRRGRRRRLPGHADQHARRAGAPGARGRQARARREGLHHHGRRGARARRARRRAGPLPHGGHVDGLQPGDPPAARRGGRRRDRRGPDRPGELRLPARRRTRSSGGPTSAGERCSTGASTR